MSSQNPFKRLFGNRPKESRVEIGRIKGAFRQRDYLTESQLNHHVHVVGASGFLSH